MWFKFPAKRNQTQIVNKLWHLLFLTEECVFNFDDTGQGETHKGKYSHATLPDLGLLLGR